LADDAITKVCQIASKTPFLADRTN